MTPSLAKIHVVVLVSTLLLAACGPTKPPPDVLGEATRKLAEARAGEAATYAPLEVRFAEERLDAASSAMAGRDYDVAARLAAESAVNSELAIVKSRLGKAREDVDTLRQDNARLLEGLPESGRPAGGTP